MTHASIVVSRCFVLACTVAVLSVACSDSNAPDPVDVTLSIAVTGEAPATNQVALSIDGLDPVLITIGDPHAMLMSPRSHTFQLVTPPHNCPMSDRPDPYTVTIKSDPSPFPVTFTLTCI